MSNTKHTPTPWVALGRDIEDSNGEHLATTYHMAGGEIGISSSNADFIVRACNNHDQMVAALKAILPFAEQHNDEGPTDESWQSIELIVAIDGARAALAAAEAA